MKRIAFFGPVKPSRTGIADYDDALLPLLKRHYEIDVFTDRAHHNGNSFPHSEFYIRHRINPYDLTLYQLGNSLFHEYMYGYLFQFPGAIVFHDYVLHHSRAPMLLKRGMHKEYAEELRYNFKEWKQIADVVLPGKAPDLLFFYFPMFLLPLTAALAAAAHTHHAVNKLSGTETPVIRIPQITLPLSASRCENPFPGKFVIASFGYATRAKRHESAMQAISHLRQFYPNLLYLIVGDIPPHYALRSKISRQGYQDFVHVTGHIEMERWLQLMHHADVVLNLRYPSAGEMSATLISALKAGKPTILTRLQQLEEIPSDAVLRVRPAFEQEDLQAHLVRLIEDPALRARMGAAARNYINQNYQDAQVVEKYRELIDLALSRKATFRPPQLPLHLRSGKEIMREYMKNSGFQGIDSDLLEQSLNELRYCSSSSGSSSSEV